MDRIERYKIEDLKNIPSKKIFTNFGGGDIDVVELHVYGGENLIASDHNVQNWDMNKFDGGGQLRNKPEINLDIHNDIRKLGVTTGTYKIQYNFLRNILGSYKKNNGLHISEISPSRKEIRVRTTSKNDKFLNDFQNLALKDPKEFIDESWQDLILNFGNNKILLAINWTGDDKDGIIFKLYKPLPKEIEVKHQLWVSKEIITSQEEIIKLIPFKEVGKGSRIAPPNFEVNISGQTVGDTNWETWDTILGTSKANKQNLMDKYLSGNVSQTHLNIDYTDYSNFIHFSSAKERLENFKYKIQLLEHYSSSIETLNTIPAGSTSSFSDNNILDYENKVSEVKNGFDSYEKYLYTNSSSYAWPKINTIEPDCCCGEAYMYSILPDSGGNVPSEPVA